MLSQVESFLSSYPSIIQTIVAISTFSAVITSLWIAQHQNKPKVLLKTSLGTIVGNGLLTHEEHLNADQVYASIEIKNRGNSPIYLTPYSIYWSASPITNMHGLATTITPIPDKIEPGASSTIIVSEIDYLPKHLQNFLGPSFLGFKVNFLKLNVKLQNGDVFQAKVCKGIKDNIIKYR